MVFAVKGSFKKSRPGGDQGCSGTHRSHFLFQPQPCIYVHSITEHSESFWTALWWAAVVLRLQKDTHFRNNMSL